MPSIDHLSNLEFVNACAESVRRGGAALCEGDFGTLGAVMISCAAKRGEEREKTIEGLSEVCEKREGWVLVLDDVVPATVERPQERQERVSLAAIEAGLIAGWDYFLFLEDDLEFNPHLRRNLQEWEPLVDGVVQMASLYNPSVAGPNYACPYANTFIADPRRVYGSQAFLLSRQCARYVARHWWTVKGMQDIKISRLASRLGPIFYHSPSLVQHAGVRSTWTEDSRFHTAPDYAEEFCA
jgi:hypothetical protein